MDEVDLYDEERFSSVLESNINEREQGFSGVIAPNIYMEIGEDKRPRTYTILQDTRHDFTEKKLKSLLLIYTNSTWEIFVLITLFVSYLVDSTIFTFFKCAERPIGVIILVICFNFIFMIDVLIKALLKYFKKWTKTLNIVEPDTARVILDICLALPYGFCYLLAKNDNYVYYHAISPIFAVVRIYRIIEYFWNKSLQAGSNQWTTFLVQYLTLFLLSVHTCTCIWYLFAHHYYDLHLYHSNWAYSAIFLPRENTRDWYFICAYWSVTMLTTNALGDLFPVTSNERIVAIVALLVGFFLTTVVFVGSLTSLFLTISKRRSLYVKQLTKIQRYLKSINMDHDTTKRIIRYYEDLWYQKSGIFKPKLLKLLPFPLQMEICYDLNAVPLYSSLIFRKLPESFLRRLSLAMVHQFYLPGDVIYNHNQEKTFMICVTKGVIELLSDEDDESPMISFSKGTCLGEISLFYNVFSRCTIKAARYVECQVLEKKVFIELMATYPDLVEKLRSEIKERIEKGKQAKQLQEKTTRLSLNIYATQTKKKSSIKCLKDKLRYIQGQTNEDIAKDDKLDESCLDLYILSEHVKKKMSPYTCIGPEFPWILEANCFLVKCWEHYMLLLVIFVCIFYPYYIGITRKFPEGLIFHIQVLITVSLILNTLISTVTAVKTKRGHIRSIKSILSYRLNTLGFYLDVVAMIPFEFIFTIQGTLHYLDSYKIHLFYFCKGVKLCLVWRLCYYFEKSESKLLLNTISIKITKYCVYLMLLCYWCGVVLYMESCFERRCSELSWFNRARIVDEDITKSGNACSKVEYPLLTSVYFSTTIMLAIGYGDLVPVDQLDMAVVAFLSLFGVLLVGYCISEFSAVVTHWSSTKTAFLEIILTVNKFIEENNINKSIKSRIMNFYELQWRYNSGVELIEENWLKNSVIPTELRKKVLHQARFKVLTSIKFFKIKNKAFIQTLTQVANDLMLPPNEILYYSGTITREMYIIESGYCLISYMSEDNKKIEKIIGPGTHLGLFVMLYGVPCVYTVTTQTHCKLLTIQYSAYASALSLFPEMNEHENLLSPEELAAREHLSHIQNVDGYMQHLSCMRNKKSIRVSGIIRKLVNDSFINVYLYYKEHKKSYWRSFKTFGLLGKIAPYVLLPIIIRPNGLFLKIWCIIRVSLAFLISLLIPISIALAPAHCTYNLVIKVCNIIMYIDLYLMLHVGFYGDKNQLIFHPYLTAKWYIKGPFILDLISCFPWFSLWSGFETNEEYSSKAHISHYNYCHCILKMINIVQIYKLCTAFWADSIGGLKRAYLMSVVQFFLLTLFFLNLYASILVIMSCKHFVSASVENFSWELHRMPNSEQYIKPQFSLNGNMVCQKGSWIDVSEKKISLDYPASTVFLLAYYWAAASLSGAGFGDITAQSTSHLILSICANIHGLLFFGYVYARIASLKALADTVVTKFQENMKHLQLFLNREKVSFALKKSIIEYWKYQWKRTGGWSHQKILGKLHSNLNEDAVLFMYEKTLREIPLFENLNTVFFRAIAKKLEEKYFQKGYVILKTNEVIGSIYIIYRGKVDVISDINEVEACMGPGGIFGNIRGAPKYLTQSTVVATRNTDILSINGRDFYNLLKNYPSLLEKVKASVETTTKDYVLPIFSFEKDSEEKTYPMTYETGDDDDDYTGKDIHQPDSPNKSVSESHGSRSLTYYFGYSYYTSAIFLICMPHRWFKRSIVPDSIFVIFMEYLIIVTSYVDFILLVYQMAFQSIHHYFYVCIAVDILFLFKLFLDIHTGFLNRYGDYVLNPRKVREKYFSNIFLRRVDFIANLPISYIAFVLKLKPSTQMAFFSYLRTPQLFRISYLFSYRRHKNSNLGTGKLLFKLTSILIWASILSHVNACIFFKLSCITHSQCEGDNWMSKKGLNLNFMYVQEKYFTLYLASLWYVINLLAITGTGDVTAESNSEVVETIIIIVIIKFCTGLLISEMSAMISAHSSSRINYDYGINELRDGFRDMGLSGHQMEKMWSYVKELWNRQQGKQMPDLILQLPFRLRCETMLSIYGSHISDSVIFKRTEPNFKRMLALWMRHCVFFPGNYIVQCGDSDQCIYFIHRGQVEVLTVHPNLTESIYDILGPEDCFGVAQGLYVGVLHHFSFRARTAVDIVYLKLDQWKYLLDFYPKSAKIVHKKVENMFLAI